MVSEKRLNTGGPQVLPWILVSPVRWRNLSHLNLGSSYSFVSARRRRHESWIGRRHIS